MSLSVRFPHQKLVHISGLSLSCYLLHSSDILWYGHPNDVGYGVLITKLLILPFFELPLSSIPFAPHTRVLQHSMLKHPYRYSLLNVRYPVAHPYKTFGRIIVLYILIFMYFYSKQKNKIFLTE